MLLTMANCFHSIQPQRVPVFTFSWIELISHRYLMPPLLTQAQPEMRQQTKGKQVNIFVLIAVKFVEIILNVPNFLVFYMQIWMFEKN